ncbi:MAG: hypothetical protein CYPHOPRED_004509 [Cyphobasidiales sp. Tagirdzhanova-0007]|nr:MAG: hypothetical protein CYPHOPRED_004509 [Cyphobasidiales sp. Tagirdzhanova-0007]
MTTPNVQLPSGVTWTALGCAVLRARESQRPDGLFAGPLAVALVAQVKENGVIPTTVISPDAEWLYGEYITLRTKFIDVRLLAAADQGIKQIVVLGAGLDGRGYRLDWPSGVQIYEVDMPELLTYKQSIVEVAGLQSTAKKIHSVPCDLSVDDWLSRLCEYGFAPAERTAWLLEGILGYLEPGQKDSLVSLLSATSPSSSHLIACYGIGDSFGAARRAGRQDQVVTKVNNLKAKGPPGPPRTWLSPHGWDPMEETTIRAWATRLARAKPPGMDPDQGGAEFYLVDARRSL